MRNWLLLAALMGLLMPSTALAENRLPVSMELSGIQKVLSIISHSNLSQTDSKANASIMDIMEAKDQMLYPAQADKHALMKRPVAASQVAKQSTGRQR